MISRNNKASGSVVLLAGLFFPPLHLHGQKNDQPATARETTAARKVIVKHRSAAPKGKKRRASRRARHLTYRQRLASLHLQPQRVEEIQQALIQAGYLKQEPTGKWDDQTRAAMRRYQEDHGFPATGLPEAKTLMKLGLGPHPLPEDVDPAVQAHASRDTSAKDANGVSADPPSSEEPTKTEPTNENR